MSRTQVILCFSPVGSVLRVRARKFPAVVNCTAINWFHEWPQDALVSVSARFLEETEGIQASHWGLRRDCGVDGGQRRLARGSPPARAPAEQAPCKPAGSLGSSVLRQGLGDVCECDTH